MNLDRLANVERVLPLFATAMCSLNMVVYVKPGCFWCTDALAWLEARGIEHKAVDVFSDRGAFSRMKEISGQSKAPTLEMPDGEVLADFDVGQLERFLKREDAR
ncbi:MAG: glutaredoxin family protein [Spartobacteria bacterium]